MATKKEAVSATENRATALHAMALSTEQETLWGTYLFHVEGFVQRYKAELAERFAAYGEIVKAKAAWIEMGKTAGEFEADFAERAGVSSREVRYYLAWGGIDETARSILIEHGHAPAHDLTTIARGETPERQRKYARIFVNRGRQQLEEARQKDEPVETVEPRKNAKKTTLYAEDALDVLRGMADESVDLIVTSPPYWQLRAFKSALGLEDTPAEYVAHLLLFFGECYRVLKKTGVLMVNIGDTAAQGNGKIAHFSYREDGGRSDRTIPKERKPPVGLKSKDLVGVPWMLAVALRDKLRFFLRDEIVWEKENPQPEPVRDRCVRVHEKVFLLSKSPRYFWNAKAIRETSERSGSHHARNVWKIAGDRDSRYKHPARFPVELARRCIRAACPKGGVVLDIFTGVGTTNLAALEEERESIGIDIDPGFIAKAKRRVEAAGGVVEVGTVTKKSSVVAFRKRVSKKGPGIHKAVRGPRPGGNSDETIHHADRRQRPMRGE